MHPARSLATYADLLAPPGHVHATNARANMKVIRVFTGHRLRALDLGDGRFRVGVP